MPINYPPLEGDMTKKSKKKKVSKTTPAAALSAGTGSFPSNIDSNMLSLTALSLAKVSNQDILDHIFHGHYPATKSLDQLGYDGYALAALAAQIRAAGVHVDTAAIQQCTTVGDVLKAMAAA
jgi:hypothetical protein